VWVCVEMTVFKECLVTSVMNLLNNCNSFVVSYHLTCCITLKMEILNGVELLPDALHVLFKFQVHVIHDMSLKLDIANSVCQRHCCIMDYFRNLLLRSFFRFYISASVANKLHIY